MSLIQACSLFLAAWVSGVLNSVAGGGGLIIFPALILAGLPAISANATSTVASWPGCIASLCAYRRELHSNLHLLLFGSVSLVGSLLGAVLLLYTPATVFDRLVPYLLLFATLLFSFSSLLATRLKITFGETGRESRHPLATSFVYFFIAVYGGFYGLGITFLMLAAMGISGMKNMHEMNALKVLSICCIDISAIAIFANAGVVAWPQAVLMAMGTIVGGYSGAYYALQLKPQLVRLFVIAVGFSTTCYFFYRQM